MINSKRKKKLFVKKYIDLNSVTNVFEQLKTYIDENVKLWDLEKIINDMNFYVYRVIRSSNKKYKYVTACYVLIFRNKKLRWIKSYEMEQSFSNSIEESWKLSEFDSKPEVGSIHNKRIRI